MTGAILLFGGVSEERLVSVASAQNVSSQFTTRDRELWFIAPDGSVVQTTRVELCAHQRPFQDPFRPKASPFARSVRDALHKLKGRAVFLALHGTEGEDGSLQDMFNEAEAPYTGSDGRSSRRCFDKIEAKLDASRIGLQTAEHVLFTSKAPTEALSVLADLFKRHGRIVMKPVANGSSVGLHIISRQAELDEAARVAASYDLHATDRRFMAEAFVSGREVTVGVVDATGEPEALPVSEVILEAGRSFDYEGKYLGRGTLEVTPADLSPEQSASCQRAALQAHLALGCFGYSRTDFILTDQGPTFLETNTLPGLSRSSFIPQQLQAAGQTLPDFVERQIALAVLRHSGRGRS